MSGTCLNCGCTGGHACDAGGEPCRWIDDQRDLCWRCARELFRGAIEPASFRECEMVIRALRVALYETARRVSELEQFVHHLAAGAEPAGIEVPSPIWTPE